jgi:hypothetical protein
LAAKGRLDCELRVIVLSIESPRLMNLMNVK